VSRSPSPADASRRLQRVASEARGQADTGGRWQNGLVPEHYQRPGWFTTNVFNRLVAVLTRLGVSVYGSRVLEVKGRKSGEWRQTPVNLLHYDGADYLVAPRGHTQWVKNLRASSQGRLRVGRRTQPFTAVELADDEKPLLLRAYLKKWKFEVGVFFGGVGPDSSDEELRRIAPDHPVFRLTRS
jgi:deazaflavin-dependent oxidoreductase (nitroreductase family)